MDTRDCAVIRALGLVAEKWKVAVIDELARGPGRYGALHRRLPATSRKVLTETLRGLERDGVVSRTETAAPLAVEYALTRLGWSLYDQLAALRNWADRHLADVEQARARYDRQVR